MDKRETVKELAARIGGIVTLNTREGLHVACRVRDARINYGNTQIQVEPLNGTGSAWVDASRTRETRPAPGQDGTHPFWKEPSPATQAARTQAKHGRHPDEAKDQAEQQRRAARLKKGLPAY